MKLFAFQPRGHGQKSFFVMAEDEKEAKESVRKFIASEVEKSVQDGATYCFDEYDCDGWDTDYYKLTALERGQVLMNDND